jgi:hypothetical protein
MFDEAQEVGTLERYAPLRRFKSRARDVYEDRAAASFDARAVVVADYYDEVVEVVVAPKALGARRVRMTYPSIVVPVADIITPAVVDLEHNDGQP